MDEPEGQLSVTILCFGPLKDAHGRVQQIALTKPVSCRELINRLGADSWIDNGLKVAVNGEFCELDSLIIPGDELALLPPVSGG